jgi:hypothetical protein
MSDTEPTVAETAVSANDSETPDGKVNGAVKARCPFHETLI